MVALAVGTNSYFGKLRIHWAFDNEETILQGKLNIIANNLGNVVLQLCFIVFAFLMIYDLVECYQS